MTFNDDWLDSSEEEEEALPISSAAVERRRRRRRRAQMNLPWWVLAAGSLVVILAIALLWVWALKAMQENKEPPTIAVTPTFTLPIATATPPVPADTPTPVPPTDTPVPPTPTMAAQIAIGGWVKVVGTGDAGLSFRAGPGQENVRLKILADGAVLKVLDGPREDDGFTWWRLEEYVDGQAGIIGWSIDEYLVPASAP